ncbi:unnamed protein product [Bursaphelenchus okinawaensis]|uniref:NF-kappa-B-activating protein C-terminal domain-containing protein n=1 Tax=Bursaphelenchus okinawaensis TaxID=465554 RepID=A0A811LLU3_9BILA|nr:unnamed protein product [Bursaphelenchus okinawaensis]CAG9126097.1 unnamed protein product [Bursaphelenchus okinawaensis]
MGRYRSRSPSPYTKPSDKREEDKYWERRREKRANIAADGVRRVWGLSPTRDELQQIYEEFDEIRRKKESEDKKAEKVKVKQEKKHKKRKRERSSSAESEVEEKRKKKKKRKKEKKSKSSKKHKKKKSESSESSSGNEQDTKDEEWVELTKEIREEVEQQQRIEEIGPQIPEHLLKKNEVKYFELDANDRKNMPRGEAAAMAAYAAQGKRIPRRGEIGLSSDEIATFEQVGYVMSGTRHKSMEATRLRKENQILTAEEKRLLSGFTSEQRKEKEDAVMNQFKSLVSSKRVQQ